MTKPETLKPEDFVFRVDPAPPRMLVTIPPAAGEEVKIDRHITLEEAKDVIRKLADLARPHLFPSKDASPETAERLLKQAHALIAAGILSEDGGDPEAGLTWMGEVEKMYPTWGPPPSTAEN